MTGSGGKKFQKMSPHSTFHHKFSVCFSLSIIWVDHATAYDPLSCAEGATAKLWGVLGRDRHIRAQIASGSSRTSTEATTHRVDRSAKQEQITGGRHTVYPRTGHGHTMRVLRPDYPPLLPLCRLPTVTAFRHMHAMLCQPVPAAR